MSDGTNKLCFSLKMMKGRRQRIELLAVFLFTIGPGVSAINVRYSDDETEYLCSENAKPYCTEPRAVELCQSCTSCFYDCHHIPVDTTVRAPLARERQIRTRRGMTLFRNVEAFFFLATYSKPAICVSRDRSIESDKMAWKIHTNLSHACFPQVHTCICT